MSFKLSSLDFWSIYSDLLFQDIDYIMAPSRGNFFFLLTPKRSSPRHIIITLSKVRDEERLLKAAREK